MSRNNKVPAFTLMEVTIAMLIAAIAIAITFTAYRIVSGSYLDFTRKQEKIATFITADKLLKQDFINARHIIKTEEGLMMEMEDGMINYHFKPDYILRDQFSLNIDTFKMKINNSSFLFERGVAEEGKSVDQLSFNAEVDGQSIALYYQKVYSAQDLFQ